MSWMTPLRPAFRRGLSRLCLVITLAGALSSAATEAVAEAPAAADAADLTPQSVQERIKQVQNSELEAEVRDRVIEFYEQAFSCLQDAAVLSSETIPKLEQEIAAAPQATRKVEEEAAALKDAPPVFIPEESSVEELQDELEQLEARLDAEEQGYAERVATIKRRAERRAELAQLRVAARQQETDTKDQLAKLPADEGLPVVAAERLLLEAQLQLIGRTLVRYDREEARNQAEQELMVLQRDLRKRRIARTEEEVGLWREGVDRRRHEEQEEQARLARQQLEQAEAFRAYPAVQALAERYRQLTELRDRSTRRISELTDEIDEVREALEALRKSFEQNQERVGKAGHTSAVGLLLRKQRASLPDLKAHRRAIAALQVEIQEVQLISTELNDRREQLSDLDDATEAVLDELQLAPGDKQRERLSPFVLSLLETERDLLDTLVSEYDSVYTSKLTSLDTEERLLAGETEKYAQYIGEHVLWIRSTAPVHGATFTEAGRAAVWLLRPESWVEAGRTLVRSAWGDPAGALLVLVLFVTLSALEPRIRERMTELGAEASRGTASNFLPTFRTGLLTGVVSALWPGLLWYLGWRLSADLDAPEAVHAVGSGLVVLALVYFPIEFFREACRSRGLAEAHFQWPASGLMVLRHNLRWLKWVGPAMAFVAGAMHAQGNVRWQDSLGRLAFLAALLAAAEFMRRVLHPQRGALSESIAYRKGGWIDRLQYVWYGAGVLVPLTLAGLAAAGYYYTAEQLVVRLYATVWLCLGLLIVSALIARWALVARRRIAMDQLRQRREALAGGEAADAGASEIPEVKASAGLDAAIISLQTRKLLQGILVTAASIGLWLIWVDVLPALSVFDEINVWSLTLEAAREVTGADGQAETKTVTQTVPITLADVIVAALVLGLTVICTKNIPGLLEMAVLQRLPLDAASRYATSMLARYTIAIVGLVSTFGALGIGWQRVQWLAAAITLGLGFGLQEIFANFVSGLIILFERPVRVGDIVTVGDVSGVVSRIRMRATTITDWDRKEMIIPNKDLITGRVLNWTLSDPVNRIMITVGVAYGTDTEQATGILQKIAREDERILKDPAPSVVFARFGESTLDFELRCFLPTIENRLPVTHELHSSIHREFSRAGIEIAFPQRDVNIRGISPGVLAMHEALSAGGVRVGMAKAS